MRVMITVKAYPALSQRSGETVCVAGVRVDAEASSWVRLFPVGFRDLPREDQFKKYQLVELRASRGTDQRPESYRPNLSSLRVGEFIPSTDSWGARWSHLARLAGATTSCRLLAEQDRLGSTAPSLGLIKPLVEDLTIERNPDFDKDRRRLAELLSGPDLFGVQKAPLEPAALRLKYRYRCEGGGCAGHDQSTIDWEAGAAARRWSAAGASEQELPKLLRRKFLDDICGPARDTYFFVGNMHRYPKNFLVLGAFWPPASSRPAPTLFG